MPKPKFDPNQSYEVVSEKKPKFNPNLPFNEVKKKVASKPLSQEELWGSESQHQDLYTSLATGAQEPQQESDGLGGLPKMKTFTGLTPEEQQTLQAKPAPDYMVKKTIEDVNLSNQRQKKLEKDLITAKDKAPIVKELTDIKRKQSESIIAPIISQVDAAHTVSEDSRKTIEDDYNTDVSGEGFWNNAKNSTYNILNEMVITPLNVVGSAVTGKGYGVIDEIVPYIKPEKPLQKYIDETIQDNKDKNISKAEFDKQVKERYVKDKERNIIQSQLNTLNSTLTDREQKAFDFNAVDNISNLTDANKNILKNAKVLESARESVYNDVISSQKEIKYLLENKQQVPQELIDKRNLSGEKLDTYNKQLQDSYDSYNKNNKDLGTFAQEHEVFKTFGNSAIDFTERVKNSLISLEASGLDVGAYIADLGAGITDEKELGKETASKLHDKAQELRKEVEYNSQFLKQQTEAVSAKDYLDKTTNFIGDNLVITAALMFGGEAGLAGMALQTTGDTYGKMVEEKKAGVKTGKDQYEPWQMALVPALWGATMVAPLAGQLATMNKTKRMLEAIAKDSPGLIEKTFAEKGYEFLKDYNVQSLKLAKDLTIMKGLQQTTNKLVLGKDVEWDQFKGTDMLGEAYGLHAMNMGMPLVFGITTKPFFSSAEVKTMTKNSNDVFNLSQKLNDPNLSKEEKTIINNTIKDITTESKDIVSKKIGDMSKLPTVVSDMVYDAFGKSSDYRAEALRIKTSDNLSPAEKKLALDGLKKRFVENEDRLAKLRIGDVVSTLPADKQIDIKNKAQRMLIDEAKGKDIKLTDEQILDRANQIYIATETIKQEAKTAAVKPAVEEVKPAVEEPTIKDSQIPLKRETFEFESAEGEILDVEVTTNKDGTRLFVAKSKDGRVISSNKVGKDNTLTTEEYVTKGYGDIQGESKVEQGNDIMAPAMKEKLTPEQKKELGITEKAKVEHNGTEYTKNKDGNWVNTKTGNEVKGIGETGKELIKTLDELSSPKTEAEKYSEELDQTKASNPEDYWSVSPVSAEDAAKGTIIDTPDGAAIVKPDGDIAGLFKKATSKAKGVAQDLLKRAVEAGGKKLDNFDGYLTKQYEKAGFRIVSRTPFNEKHGTPDVVAMIYDPEGKLDIQEKTFDEYDDAIAYRDSFLEPSLEKEIEAIGKLFDESGRGFNESQVENGKKALEEIVPGVEWIVHDTSESYRKVAGDNSKGQYILRADGTKELHINKSKADGTTVAHEVFHAVILDKILGDKAIQDITARMMKAVYKTADPILRSKLDDFAKMYPDGIKNEERLAQLIGLIADGYKEMTPVNKGIVKRWLDALAKTFGLKKFTDNEVIDLLNTLARKVSTGEVISAEDVAMFKGGKKVDIPSDGLTKRSQYGNDKVKLEIKYLEQDKVEELKKKGLLIEPENLSSLNGKKVVTTSPDDMLVGSIYANGKEIATGSGGVYFVTKFGDVWANSNKAVANGLTKAINETYDPATGKSYLALVKGTDAKLVSSPQGVTSSLAVTESMIDAGLFSLSDFRSSIRAAVKTHGGEISLSPNGSAKVLKSEVDSFFKDVNSSTFEKRGNVLRDIVSNLAKSESAKNNKIEIIKFLDGDESKGLGVGKTEKSQSLIDLIATTSAEKLTKGLNTGDVYAVIEIDGKVKVVQDSHQSYPYHIKIVDENGNISNKKPVLILPKNRRNGKEILTSVDGKTAEELGSGFSGKVGATANMPYGKGIIMDDSVSTIKRSQLEEEGIEKVLSKVDRSQKEEKLIDNYVRVSRENGFSDAAVSAFLKSKGFSDSDIADAIALKKEKSNPFKAFFNEDVAPVFKSKAEAVYETGKAVVNALSPKTGVEKGVVSKFYELVGDRNKSNTIIDKQVKEYEDMFDRMSTTERVDFVDNMKAGKPQASPELDNVAKVISELDKDLYNEITKYKPNMAWKENHFRVLWKKIPGTTKEKFWSFMSKRPLRGTQGFMRQSTLTSMTEGIAKGGEPHSTNPITMFKLAYDDSMKYITSQRIITSLKSDGVIKFVKSGGEVPEGYVKINDNVANVYFKSDTGMVKTGEYWIQEGPGRMLNNMLSRDLIRDTKLGESLMGIKNLYTQVELGLSPFHAVAITLEQIASGMGIGARKIFNLGDVVGGIKDILEAPFSPKSTFSLGRDVFKFATVKDFENSEAGKKLLERMPNAKEYIGDFFQGGGLMKQHDDLKSNTYKALKEQVGKDNYIGAALRALPAINEGIMSPLFNVYIPTLKIGLFMREFPLILAENKSRLESGKVTREELSRKVVDSVDNRLGEMNFDNLYWNKTFKTATQFMLRSVTWKLGNIRQMGMAPIEQAQEFIDATKEGRRPNLSPKMAWLFGLSLTQVVISSVMQQLYLDDDDKDKDIKDFKDIVAPRINSSDKKERVVIPTYYKDLLHFWHAPTEYVTSGVSGPLGKGIELYKNVDFYGYEIRDENDPATKQLIDAGKYVMPKPFSISSFQKMKEKGEPFNKQALSFLGFNKAPGYLEQNEIESEIIDLYRIRNTSVKPIKQKEGNDAKKEIRTLYKTDKEAAQKLADNAVDKGILKPTQITYLFRNIGKNDDAGVYFFSRLPASDKEYLYSKMSKEDKERFDPKGNLLSQEEKDARLKARNPKVYEKIMKFRARRKNAQ